MAEQGGSSSKTQLRVTIYNQTYTLNAESDPSETEQVAQMVHDAMCRIAARAGNLDTTRIAVLTGLHLADKLRTAEKEIERLRGRVDQVDRKAKDMNELLDSVFNAGPNL